MNSTWIDTALLALLIGLIASVYAPRAIAQAQYDAAHFQEYLK